MTGLSFCHDSMVYPTARVVHVCEGVVDSTAIWHSWANSHQNVILCGVKHAISERVENVKSWVQVENLIDDASNVDGMYCVECLKHASMILMSTG